MGAPDDSKVFVALLHLAPFFLVGFWFPLAIWSYSGTVFGISIAALCSTPVKLQLSDWSIKRESAVGQTVSFVLSTANLVFIIYELAQMYDNADYWGYHFYRAMRQRQTAYGVLALLSLATTMIAAVLCWCNFGQGLKAHLRWKRTHDVSGMSNSTGPPESALHTPEPSRTRMELD
jgi:uncharacterized membrane protein